MAGINTPRVGDLSLKSLLSKNPKEIREILEKCSVDELERLENEAAKSLYKIAEIIKEVKDGKNKSDTTVHYGDNGVVSTQLAEVMSADNPNKTTTEESDDTPTKESSDQENPNKEKEISDKEKEISDKAKKYLDLYYKEVEYAKKVETFYESQGIRWKGLEDGEGVPIYIKPRQVKFDGDVIFVDDPVWGNYHNHEQFHLFKVENGEIEGIKLLKDKISGNKKIRRLCKVGDYYNVNLCEVDGNELAKTDYNGKVITYNYIVNKYGEYLPQLGKQTGKEEFRITRFGGYEFEKDSGDNKVTRMIFNKNMEQIAEFEDIKHENNKESRKYIEYCDDEICIICGDGINGLYKVFLKNKIVREGTKKDLELDEDLKKNENMKGYWEMKNQEESQKKESDKNLDIRKSTPVEERYKDINHCIIEYEDDKKTVIIKNDKGKTLFKLSNIKEIYYYYENTPTFITDTNDRIEIHNWTSKSNVLFIKILDSKGNINNCKSIFINKTKRENEKKEFKGREGCYSFLRGKLIEVFIDKNNAKIFNDNLDYLGDLDKEDDNGYRTIKGKDGKIYIASTRLGKIVGEYGKNLQFFKDGEERYLVLEGPEGPHVVVV